MILFIAANTVASGCDESGCDEGLGFRSGLVSGDLVHFYRHCCVGLCCVHDCRAWFECIYTRMCLRVCLCVCVCVCVCVRVCTYTHAYIYHDTHTHAHTITHTYTHTHSTHTHGTCISVSRAFTTSKPKLFIDSATFFFFEIFVKTFPRKMSTSALFF